MSVTMKPKRKTAAKRAVGTKRSRKLSASAAIQSKSAIAAQREMDQWFHTHSEQVYQAARANTRALFGREEI